MQILKQLLLSLFIKFLKNETVQQQINRDFMARNQSLTALTNAPPPYADFQSETTKEKPSDPKQEPTVFITSRFRSGSTFLWNIFRQLDGCTAYYEPFNERQWFNQSKRGNRVDATHLGVKDYWKEFEGMDDLEQFYEEDWIRHSLYMDAKTWNPKMKRYIDELILRAKGQPVLQFNRIDFRLPWLKQNYPDSKIIHLFRHPRDQWVSFLTDRELMNYLDVKETYIDGFYLDSWCEDLSKHYPFLSKDYFPHPYQRFYLLWKLSYLFGQTHSDLSICFEDLVENPRQVIGSLFAEIYGKKDDFPWDRIMSIVKKPVIGKWKNYAPDEWFSELEQECEQILKRQLI